MFESTFILRRPEVPICHDIIKNVTMFIKNIFKDSRKVKRIRNYVSKCNLYLHFLIRQNLIISGEKVLMSAELKGCVTWFIYFLGLLEVRYSCAKFHYRICVTDFRKGGPFCPSPQSVSSQKKTILNGIINWI